ncbi:MAG: hypothetical protein Q9191_004789 [Dirinaria sp. TL-2023a]
MESKNIQLGSFKGRSNGDVRTTYVGDEEYLGQAHHVSAKYAGTAADQRDMSVLGRDQVLRRNFRFISIVGFGCTLISTWEVILTLLSFVLTDGGTAGLVWGYVAIVIGFMLVYMSLAEMASMAPTSGGQYHWVSEFAPQSGQKFLSFITGWLCATGWQCAIVSISFLAGTIIQGLIILNDPTYVFERWHGTMLVIAITSFAILFNTFLAKKLPMVEGLILIIHIVGLFAIVIPLWVLAPRNTAKVVFTEFTNGGGWSSKGTSVMVGLSTSIVSMLGFDCGVHMSEEIKDASDTLPRAITWAVVLNAILGFIMVLTLCFCLGDVNAIMETDTLFPFIQIFYNTTKSYGATDVMVTILIVTLTSSAISEVATASRQLWSFARDNGLPFSATLSYVSLGGENLAASQLTLPSGHAWMEHSTERSHGIFGRDHTAFSYQYRVDGCFECHHLSDYLLTRLILYDHHQLRSSQTAPEGAPSRTTVVPRTSWTSNQCRRTDVPDADFRFRLLSTGNTNGGKHDELEYCHFWWDYHLRNFLLCRVCEARICTAGGTGEKGNMT